MSRWVIFIKTQPKTIIKKEFYCDTYLMCIAKVKQYVDSYNLELLSLNLKKQENEFKCVIEYGLGVER